MANLYEDLSWLPNASHDFEERLLLAKSGSELRDLAKYCLDENQLRRLSKKLHALQDQQLDITPLTIFSMGIISNATTKLMASSMVGTALRFGIALTTFEAEYNQVAQEALSSESIFSKHKLNVILVAIDYRGVPFKPTPGDLISAQNNVKDCFSYIKLIVDSLRTKTGAQIILQNIAPPAESLVGSYEGRLPGTLSWLCSHLNFELDSLVSEDTFIVDIAGLAANVGLVNWHDLTLWNMAKLPFSQQYIPIYADFICRILAARLGKSRRCLILDLDNTLWGGIIGDDGLEGILIGNGNPTAEAHLHLQHTILELRDRGVVLAVSSKNEDAAARQPFKEHPDMLIRENHIAVFQANWSDKASNIRAIAETLSLGLESIVFLDDNPAERMQVRKELPEVAVPELPHDPALYARTLIAAGYFEAIVFSSEDSKRASFYQDNAKRASILSQSSDMDSYLKSLEMEIALVPFDSTGRARIAQLISKSNQFNLTTKRYSEIDVKRLEEDDTFYTRQIRLKDTLGDNGMISVIICKKNELFWEIDSWLMSCRVLGRRVEEAALLDIVGRANEAGAHKLIGTYIATARNIIVKDHYLKLGFTKTSKDAEAETWELNLDKYQIPQLPIEFKYAL